MPKPGNLIGAIDAGSNAIRFSIFKLDSRLYPLRVHHKRYPVRLGAGTFATGALGDADMDAALEAFRDITATVADRKVSSLHAVATSAIREASNGDEFLARVKSETGIDLRIIDGPEEARLAALAAAPPVQSERDRLIIDIGGGSTEIILVRPDGHIEWNLSIPLGAVRIAQEWEQDDPIKREETIIARLTAHLDDNHVCTKSVPADAIALGGTANALYHLCIHIGCEPGDNRIWDSNIRKAVSLLQSTPIPEIPRTLNVEASRACILLPGAMILSGILKTFGITEVAISDASVREGLVLDYLTKADT